MAHISDNDLERSYTSQTLSQVVGALKASLGHRQLRSYADLGCGYGGIAATIAEALSITRVVGVDIDADVIDEARAKGVQAEQHNIASGSLPYDDAEFDLVTSFGVLDYFAWFDDIVLEMRRVLEPGGVVAISLPNLASWHNRLGLLFGYQPRDVEFSSRYVTGVSPKYRDPTPVGHIHCPTTRAFCEFMDRLGFEQLHVTSLRAQNFGRRRLLSAVDATIGRSPYTARRFLYLGTKAKREPEPPAESWWQSRSAG